MAVCGLRIAVASLCFRAWALGMWASVVMAHGLSLLHSMWDLPGPGLEPMSPALAGGFLTTAPPGKPLPMSFAHFSITILILM